MPENIYEEAVVKIKATIREGGMLSKAYTGKLDLIFEKNGAEIEKRADLEVPKGSLNTTYTAKKVEGTEDSYALKVIARYGKTKEKSRVLVDAIVWPKSVQLKIQHDSKPAKNVGYEVVHVKGKATKGNTNDQGIGTEDLKKCAYSITINAPYQVVTNKNDAHKREHDIVVRTNQVAKFLKPDVNKDVYVPATEGGDKTAGVRQYVNVASTEEGCDANSSIVEFEVCHQDQPSGMNGDKIYLKVTYSGITKRNLPKPALLAPATSILESNGGKTFTGVVQLTADGGSAKFKVEMGYAGGETITVTCGYTEADPSDDKLVFVTWRKLAYQLRFPSMMKPKLTERTREDGSKYLDIPDSIYSVAKARLKPVFIEYVNIKSHEYDDPPTGAPSLVTKGFIEETTDTTVLYLLDGKKQWIGTASGFDPAADNREIHITLCDSAYSGNTKRLTPTFKLVNVVTEKIIDSEREYCYFDKTPQEADKINFTTTGFKWKAKMSAVASTDKEKKPTIAVNGFNDDLGAATVFRVAESFAGAPPFNVTTTTANVLPQTEKNKIKAYYEACFKDPAALRENGYLLNFAVGGEPGPGRTAVETAINEIHTASKLKVANHPGFDDTGAPRQGEMSEITFEHVNGRKKRFKLPTGGPNCPGDFVGAASATTCPIEISFAMDGAYAINGNAGGGAQLMVMRTAVPAPCASTVLHELGHSMGMTVFPTTGAANGRVGVPPGLDPPKHVDNGGTYYRNKSDAPYNHGWRTLHVGSHCCDGMPAQHKADKDFNDWDTGPSDQVCIMWGSGGDDDNRTKYCTTCTEILKARNLSNIRAAFTGRTGESA